MNTLYKNSLLYLLATLSVKAASFILLPFYSYLISPAEYGYIYIVVSFVSFMSIMMTFSVSASISRFYIDCEGIVEVRKMFSTIVYTVVGCSLIIGSSLLYFHEEIAFWLNIPSLYLIIAIISSILSCFYLLITNLLYIRQEAKKISLTSMGMGILQIVIQLSMVLCMNDKALAMICSQLICALVTFVIFIVYSKSYLVFSYDRRKVFSYVKYAFSQFPSDVSVWLLSFSDRLMMNKMQGNSATGVYGMGQTLGSVPKIIFSSINSAYVPFVFNCYKNMESDAKYRSELINQTTRVFSIVTMFVAIIILFSNNIVALLDSKFSKSTIVMAAMLFAMLIDSYRTIFTNPLAYNIKYTKIKSSIWCMAALLNIVLNIYLIPRYSIYGACFAMIISYGLSFSLIAYFARKAIPVNYDIKKMLIVFAASLVMSSFVCLGTSLIMLIIKVIFALFYSLVIARLLKIDVFKFLKIIKINR